MLVIPINGFDMCVEVRGNGEPLVLLHGGMGIGADWRLVFPTDPDGYRVIVPDLRGHGRSTNPAGVFTFQQCARDVLALLDYLGIESMSAIGLSMGAKTLLHVATLAPSRVRAMVLVSAAPSFPADARTLMARYTEEALDSLPASEREALGARHPGGADQLRSLYAMTRGFATNVGDMSFTASTLAAITAPTLVVHGDRDPLYPIELALELYRGISGSELWVVPNGGHGPIFGPLAPSFASTALAFLRTHTRTNPSPS